MITSYRLPALPSAAPRAASAPPATRPASPSGSWRYDCRRHSRGRAILAALLSAALHGALILGLGQAPRKIAAPKPAEVLAIQIVIPDLKELEPEPVTSDDVVASTDATSFVPMQADLPQIPKPSDFVQQIDFSTLIDRPDFSEVKLLGIPETLRRGSGKIAESIGTIFNPADLDRVPEPLFQPAPIYPTTMRRDGVTATVVVEFIVDSQGRAFNAVVTQSTYRGFEDAAITGVEKWKFRPGIRAGRKVNTRMSVPIVFSLAEPSP